MKGRKIFEFACVTSDLNFNDTPTTYLPKPTRYKVAGFVLMLTPIFI